MSCQYNIIESSMGVDDIIKKLADIKYKRTFKAVYIRSLPDDFEEYISNRSLSIEDLLSFIFAPHISLRFSDTWLRKSMYRMFAHSTFNSIMINTFKNIVRTSHLFFYSNINNLQLDASTMGDLVHANGMFENANIKNILVRNKNVSNFSPIDVSDMFSNVNSIENYVSIIESIRSHKLGTNCTNMFDDAFIDTGMTFNIEKAISIRGMFKNSYCQLIDKTIDIRSIHVDSETLYDYRDALSIAPIENRKIRVKFILNKHLDYPRIIDIMLGKSYLYNTIQIVSKPEDDYFTIIQTERTIF